MTIETLTDEERAYLNLGELTREGKAIRIIDQLTAALSEARAEVDTMVAINRDQSERLLKTQHQLAAANALLERVETAMGRNLPQELRDDIWKRLGALKS